MSFSDLSLRRYGTGEAEPRHELYIAGEVWTDRVEDIVASYDDPSGGSELTFEAHEPLEDYAEARTVLYLGYGAGAPAEDLVPWFGGKLLKPVPSAGSLSRASKAYGPFADMARAHFGEQVAYRGRYIESALYDICRRADFPAGTVEVRGGRSFLIEEEVFVEEVTLLEAATAITQSAGFVQSDMPGQYGARLFMPAPKPGATGRFRAVYTEDDYPHEGLRVSPKRESAYSRVVVFRRNPDGTYAVRSLAPVRNEGRFGVPRNRTYYITDFPGSATQAKQTAYDTAGALVAGEYGFELSVPVNPELRKFDQISFERLADRRGGTYREVYAGRILDSLRVSVRDWEMTLRGEALLLSSSLVAPERIVVDLSESVLRPPVRGLAPQEDLTPAEDLVPH
jgi:hypothetical protein